MPPAEAVAPPPPEATAPPADEPRTPPKRKVPAAGYAAPSGRDGDAEVSPMADLVTTTVAAANELAQIGMEVGRAALRSFLDRLPKP